MMKKNSADSRKILVIGGGAAGMMAAIAAARQGAAVTLLDGMDRPGRKLLVTGNGRCNLTNMDDRLHTRYYGSGADLADKITGKYDGGWTREFFLELGLFSVEKNGYVYPCSMQSGSVLDVLMAELRRLRVKMKLKEKAVSVRENPAGGWSVLTQTWQYEADGVILACGSRAMPSTGSDGSGYSLAKQLGHSLIPPAPALVPITCKEKFLTSASGVRCRAEVSLYRESRGQRKAISSEIGEVQWTSYGVSGIVVFQLSRFVSGGNAGSYSLELNLLPEQEQMVLKKLLQKRAAEIPEEKTAVLMHGLLHEKLVPLILQQAQISAKAPCSSLTKEKINDILNAAMHFTLQVTGTKDFDVCQVCSGGVDCREVSADTLESKIKKNLYFAGEILDVDGPCGGYNLQWAWASGYLAGISAADFPII